jgi:hypothetical protein
MPKAPTIGDLGVRLVVLANDKHDRKALWSARRQQLRVSRENKRATAASAREVMESECLLAFVIGDSEFTR